MDAKARRWLVLGSVLLFLHGVIELLSVLYFFFPIRFHFVFEELNQAWEAVAVVGIVLGALRVAAAAGILKNRMWGLVLGILLSLATFSMLTLYLPAGAMDALLAGGALLALLLGKYQAARILENY